MRRIIVTLALIVSWVLITCAILIAEQKLIDPPVRRGDILSISNYAVQKIQLASANKHLGCAALVIIEKGNRYIEQDFGQANPQTKEPVKIHHTLFLLSSLSKAVTTWGVMKLVQDGKLKLDEPVINHLKRWRFSGSNEAYANKVTVRHLLSHTAGFVDGYGHGGFLPGEQLQTIEESLNHPKDANQGKPRPAIIQIEPGTALSYSSAGYAVLQLLIEEITGKPFNQYMKEAVFKPLGMFASDYELDSIIAHGRGQDLATNYDLNLKPHPHRRYTNMAGVSLRSSAQDIARLALAYYNPNPVLTKESINLMVMPQPATDSSWTLGHTVYASNNAGGYVIGHGGGAFPASGAEMRLNPATGNGIIILASGTQGLISEIADTWTYWETGKKVFDIRNVVRDRLIHAIVLIVLGSAFIIWWQVRKKRS